MKQILPALLLAIAFGAPAYGQSSDASKEDEKNARIYVGAASLLNSEYLGSADEDFRVLPYLSVDNFKGFDLFGPSLSYRAIEIGTGRGLDKWSLRAGPVIGYESGRDSDDSDTLTGLEDIDGSFVAGGYVRSTLGPVGLQFNAGQDIAGGHGGVTANASIGTFLPLGRLNVQPAATVSWGSNSHNQSFFGITEAQANLSGLDINDVDSGIYAYSLNLVSWYELNDDYAITLIGAHRWFTEEANNSPIINAADGSDTGLFLSVGLVRRFDF